MEREEVVNALESAVRQLKEKDSHLRENDLSERYIAARLAMYLQPCLPSTRWTSSTTGRVTSRRGSGCRMNAPTTAIVMANLWLCLMSSCTAGDLTVRTFWSWS